MDTFSLFPLHNRYLKALLVVCQVIRMRYPFKQDLYAIETLYDEGFIDAVEASDMRRYIYSCI